MGKVKCGGPKTRGEFVDWEDGTTCISITTNSVFICPNHVTHIQKICKLPLRYWQNTKENIPSLKHQYEQQLNAVF